jgi:hypothetical protein
MTDLMTIEIDANNDVVRIIPPAGAETVLRCKHAYAVKGLLDEIFNAIDPKGVALTYVDEDRRTTIGEW